ncbi:MAG: response regulator [Anaerolineae bacterium]|nr:response regulator [Anaerolineae bacterium]
MSSKKRILVVENLEGLRTQYTIGLEMADFEVDSVSNLQEALDIIDAKTFHVALVDLMLNDPHDTVMQGLDILEKLRAVNEGTQAIVISGQKEPGTAVDTITEYQAADYIPKAQILNEGMGFLIKEVSQLAASTELKKFGNYKSIVSVMAGGTKSEVVWADSLLRILKPKNGFIGLQNFLTQFCEPMLPLLPQKETSPPFLVHKEQRFANGKFWSKGLGKPLELVICRAAEAAELLAQKIHTTWQTDSLLEYENSELKGYAFGLPNEVTRSDFIAPLNHSAEETDARSRRYSPTSR